MPDDLSAKIIDSPVVPDVQISNWSYQPIFSIRLATGMIVTNPSQFAMLERSAELSEAGHPASTLDSQSPPPSQD